MSRKQLISQTAQNALYQIIWSKFQKSQIAHFTVWVRTQILVIELKLCYSSVIKSSGIGVQDPLWVSETRFGPVHQDHLIAVQHVLGLGPLSTQKVSKPDHTLCSNALYQDSLLSSRADLWFKCAIPTVSIGPKLNNCQLNCSKQLVN